MLTLTLDPGRRGGSGGGGGFFFDRAPAPESFGEETPPPGDSAVEPAADSARPAPIAVTAVPEPATWALMILGFGLSGGALRARRPALTLAR